jgi:outer membrane protein
MQRTLGAVLGATLILQPFGCPAETLIDAIAMAYQTNPILRAQRAQLRADDESYVQARAGYGPQASVNGQYGYQVARVQQPATIFTLPSTVDYSATTGTADLSLTQPLYTGGAVKAEVEGAAAGVLESRQNLRQAESQLLVKVVTAYVDVRRDRETARLLREEINNLAEDDKETQAKGILGVLSKTDVAQSKARLLAARSQLITAQGKLGVSSAEYLAVVGESPGELEPEPDLPGLPTGADIAFDTANNNSPEILAAIEAEKEARQKVKEAKAANRPKISIRLDAAIAPVEPYLPKPYDKYLSGQVTITQPLFTSGLYASKVRQALEEDNQADLKIEATRRDVTREVASQWEQFVATRDADEVLSEQVKAQEEALKGDHIEERAGLRSTIELLNAEAELNNAKIALVQGRHDAYVASASLLAAMGLLEVRFLDPDAQLYDPVAALKRVQNRILGPWTGLIGKIDGLGGPSSDVPALSAPDAGAARPPVAASSPDP